MLSNWNYHYDCAFSCYGVSFWQDSNTIYDKIIFSLIIVAAIKMKIELDVHTGDETYLGHIRRKLPEALDEFEPDIVVYNAGTLTIYKCTCMHTFCQWFLLAIRPYILLIGVKYKMLLLFTFCKAELKVADALCVPFLLLLNKCLMSKHHCTYLMCNMEWCINTCTSEVSQDFNKCMPAIQ